MNQEPIAWMSPDGKVSQTEGMLFYIPLYTTSQTKKCEPICRPSACDCIKPKPLSDEEIMEIFKAYEQMQEYGYVGKKPFQVHLGWSLEDKNSCLMLARAIEERHGIK